MYTLHLLDDHMPEDALEVGDITEVQCKHGNTGLNIVAEHSASGVVYREIRSHGCGECIGYARGYMAALEESRGR